MQSCQPLIFSFSILFTVFVCWLNVYNTQKTFFTVISYSVYIMTVSVSCEVLNVHVDLHADQPPQAGHLILQILGECLAFLASGSDPTISI